MRTIADRCRGAAQALSLAELSSPSTGLDRRAQGVERCPPARCTNITGWERPCPQRRGLARVRLAAAGQVNSLARPRVTRSPHVRGPQRRPPRWGSGGAALPSQAIWVTKASERPNQVNTPSDATTVHFHSANTRRCPLLVGSGAPLRRPKAACGPGGFKPC